MYYHVVQILNYFKYKFIFIFVLSLLAKPGFFFVGDYNIEMQNYYYNKLLLL